MDFLQGEKTDEELLTTVDQTDEKARTNETCEAHFFIGLQKSSAGDQQEAEKHFHQSIDTKATKLSAYRGSEFALKRKTAADDAGPAR